MTMFASSHVSLLAEVAVFFGLVFAHCIGPGCKIHLHALITGANRRAPCIVKSVVPYR